MKLRRDVLSVPDTLNLWDTLAQFDAHGVGLTQKRAFIRYLLSWIWFLPPLALLSPYSLTAGETAILFIGWVFAWALLSRFHPQRQFWHDAIAGTRLINAQPQIKTETST
mgnify:CR=1 FL=1